MDAIGAGPILSVRFRAILANTELSPGGRGLAGEGEGWVNWSGWATLPVTLGQALLESLNHLLLAPG